MIVRRAVFGALVLVREYAEAEFGIFVQDLALGVVSLKLTLMNASSFNTSFNSAQTFWRPAGPGSALSAAWHAAANSLTV